MFSPGDVAAIDFPGGAVINRRPAVGLSSEVYHTSRPDVIAGLVTSQVSAALGPTDCALQDWAFEGLRVASAFRCFLATLPSSAHPVLIGHLSERDWQAVRACVKAALASLDDPVEPNNSQPG